MGRAGVNQGMAGAPALDAAGWLMRAEVAFAVKFSASPRQVFQEICQTFPSFLPSFSKLSLGRFERLQ
jgi:hypothetical protein